MIIIILISSFAATLEKATKLPATKNPPRLCDPLCAIYYMLLYVKAGLAPWFVVKRGVGSRDDDRLIVSRGEQIIFIQSFVQKMASLCNQ